MPTNPNLRIATRTSRLALWQAEYVQGLVKAEGLDSSLVERITKGDQILDRPLQEIGGKGLFIKELEQALLDDEADIAAHSLKDLPVVLNDSFKLTAIMKRHSPHDVIVVHPDSELMQHSKNPESIRSVLKAEPQKLATSSLRRSCQIKNLNKQHEIFPIRGNIDTRLGKLKESSWDGILLAEASLDRLSLKESLTYIKLDAEWFTPCAAQGALGIESLSSYDAPTAVLGLNDPLTACCVDLERRILALLGGDCHLPFGCFARVEDDILKVTTKVFQHDGEYAEVDLDWAYKGTEADYQDCALTSVSELFANGGHDIFKSLGISLPDTTLKFL